MAKIADRASISRPALYQYYADKNDIFIATLDDAFSTAIAAALAELDLPGPVAERLDGFLQRYHGDLKALVIDSPRGDELLTFKADHGAEIVASAAVKARKGLGFYLGEVAIAHKAQDRSRWCDLLQTAPMGFWADDPSLTEYRERLTALATAVAAAIAL